LIGRLQSISILSSQVEKRIDEPARFSNKIQEDPETGASLCEIGFLTQKALVWVRTNGSVGTINGKRLLLAGGKWPKTNPSLSCFMKYI